MEGRSYYLALQCTEDGARLHLGLFMSPVDAQAAVMAFHRRSEPGWTPVWHEESTTEPAGWRAQRLTGMSPGVRARYERGLPPIASDTWYWADTAYADERWFVIPLQVGANIAEW